MPATLRSRGSLPAGKQGSRACTLRQAQGRLASAGPSPRALPRGAARRPSRTLPADCAGCSGLSPTFRNAPSARMGHLSRSSSRRRARNTSHTQPMARTPAGSASGRNTSSPPSAANTNGGPGRCAQPAGPAVSGSFFPITSWPRIPRLPSSIPCHPPWTGSSPYSPEPPC